MIGRTLTTAALAVLAIAPSAFAQGNTSTQAAKAQWDMIKVNLSKTAAKVPEEVYAFKPTPAVRSLGEIIGHVADSNFGICAVAAGEKPPQSGFEKGKTKKADLMKAMNDSIAYCDKVLAGMTDQKGMEKTDFLGGTPRLFVLVFNIGHCNEHYGNLVTYMRLKGIVPPSSESGGRMN
jgi:uncharacterized damage-inducible protein DinB